MTHRQVQNAAGSLPSPARGIRFIVRDDGKTYFNQTDAASKIDCHLSCVNKALRTTASIRGHRLWYSDDPDLPAGLIPTIFPRE